MSNLSLDFTFRAALTEAASGIGHTLTETQIDACAIYFDLLLETNAHTNLTRITEPAEVAVKHFADSLSLLRAVPDLPLGALLADIGTGAGFPGLVVKIARPDLRVTLIDSLAKRLTFLRGVVDTIGLTGVTLVHSRAEDAGRLTAHRDNYDLVTARAVAALPVLLEWCGPLVSADAGRFVAMKAGGVDEELARAETAAALLNLQLESDISLTLPAISGVEESPAARRLLVYRKRGATPAKFPRRAAEIKANPLG